MAKRVYNGNDILPPSAAGQIPIATPNSDGRLVYAPVSVSLPNPATADAGKVLAINTVSSTGVTYKYEALTPIDPLLLSFYNQNGVLLAPLIGSRLAFGVISGTTKDLALYGSGNAAVFFNPTTNVRTTQPIPNTIITITTTGDATYLFMNPDGTFGQVHSSTDPGDFKTVNYLCKAYHPGGGDIISTKPIYTVLSHPQDTLRQYGYGLGIMAQGFRISYLQASAQIQQVAPYAVVSGYNINPNDPMPSQRIFPASTSSVLGFQYWSWNVADRVASKSNLLGAYHYDNPAAGTSTAIPAGQFGIATLFAGSDGTYIIMAPQSVVFTTIVLAESALLDYVGSMILPQLLIEQYDIVAAFFVPSTIAANTAVTVINLNSIAVGGTPKDDLLPAPTTPGVVKVLPGSNAYSIQPDVPTPVVDLTGFVDGDILGVTAGKIAPVKPNMIFPTNAYKDALEGYFRVVGNVVSHVALDLVNSGITITISPFGSVEKQAVFTGLTNFWLHSGIYETSIGQAHFGILSSTVYDLRFDTLYFNTSNPRTFSDGTQGFDFQILYLLL